VQVTVQGNLTELSDGYVFTQGPEPGKPTQAFQIIMTSRGDPVYHVHRKTGPYNLAPTHNGQLTQWVDAWGAKILGPDYAERARFSAKHGGTMNPHEFQLTKIGNGLLFAWDTQILKVDDFHVNDKGEKPLVGITVEEITPTGEVVFEWRSWDHLPLVLWETEKRARGWWHLLHANAMEEAHDGHILLSMRRMSQIAKIHRDTGELLWRLGGNGSDFRIVNDAKGQFRGQHDVRDLGTPEGKHRISAFDNRLRTINETDTVISRAVEYDLYFDHDGRPTKARLVNEYDTGIRVGAKGSYRRMPNGNGVYCLGVTKKKRKTLGTNPFYIERDSRGRELVRMEWNSRLYRGYHGTYRTVKAPWIGTPAWPPTALLDDNNKANTLRLHFSWNGATEVKTWRIIMGPGGDDMTAVVEIEKTQFEHWVDVPDGGKKCQYFQAVALNEKGKEMSRSEVVHTKLCK